MLHPFFGAKDVCYIEKKGPNKKLFLGRPACTARRAVFSSDLISMSKDKPWLLVFMALGENLKISIFDPPLLEGPLNSDEELYLVAETTSHLH